MSIQKTTLVMAFLACTIFTIQAQQHNFANDNATMALPTLVQNPNGKVILHWSEKDAQNKISLYFAESADQGKTFGEKQLIYSEMGIGTGKLARPRLLFKKNGEMWAFFTHRINAPAAPAAAKPAEAGQGGHAGHSPAPAAAPAPKRDVQIRYAISKDQGKTWTAPASADGDTSRLVRGFFDVAVLPNDEIAVVYLKDVKGSTKHEERDLRMVLTKKGAFQPEKLLDAVVCDCCNISLLVGKDGQLNVYYRDNNNDIRDIARLVSKDNGQTFGKSEIVHTDNWEIKGCPHSGAVSTATKQGNYVSWYAGASKNPGIRVVDPQGKLINILDESAQNQNLAAYDDKIVWVWDQSPEKESKQVYYGILKGAQVAEKGILPGSENGGNPSVLVLKDKVLVAHEVTGTDKKVTVRVTGI
jgi:BNR repeat-like domain